MANPQKENGYTAIANELLEVICFAGLSGGAISTLLAIIRLSYGFNRKETPPLSVRNISTLTGLSVSGTHGALTALIGKGLIEDHNGGYAINKNYDIWSVRKSERQTIKCSPQRTEVFAPANAILIIKDNIKDNDQIVQTKTKTTTKLKTYSPRFLAFWDLYPRKVGKRPAWAEWQKAFPTEGADKNEGMDAAAEALHRDKESAQWQKEEFIPHPRTWLHQRRWEDTP